MVLVHNHPSGNPEPSPEDRQFTITLRQAAELVGIYLVDHVIIGDNRYYSFREQEEFSGK
jgi:DNA repair protein RadC